MMNVPAPYGGQRIMLWYLVGSAGMVVAVLVGATVRLVRALGEDLEGY